MANFETILSAYQTLPEQVQSLLLSTVNEDNTPHASYAPYVMDADYRFYVFTSGLSSHTQNLLRTKQASILIIEDETTAQQIFARQRINYDCRATVLERNSTEWDIVADQFEARFGEIIQMLRTLGDFQIFQLAPSAGRFVMGFGAAYRINPDDLSQLVPETIKPSQA
jgi:putative heme iron utilization protein